jgi:CRISPR-associated protein Cas1
MLSLPDFREKQIVFVEADEAKRLQFRNDNLVIADEAGAVSYQVSCYKIFCVFILGEISITTVLIKQALSYGIAFIFMKKNFEVFATIGAETEGNFLLRMKQYAHASSLAIAKQLVRNKVENQLQLLKSLRGKDAALKKAIASVKKVSSRIATAASNQQLLGYEGTISKEFFRAYFGSFGWYARLPRTKCDMLNTLLDIGYTYLFHFIDAHLRLYGFDTYKGFYHQDFYQRKSLVCDIVEPFRCIIDRALRNAFQLGQIDEKDFITKNRKYELDYRQSRKYAKIFLEAIMGRKEEIFLYLQSFYRCIMKENLDLPSFFIN